MKKRTLVHSHFVPHGPAGHRLNSLNQLGFGLHPAENQELVLSSAWLWNQQIPQHRFAVSYPSEWQNLQAIAHQLPDWKSYHFDIWVFQNLSTGSLQELVDLLRLNPSFRLVIAINHLMNWKSLLKQLNLKELITTKQLLLSLLPPQNQLDPFLKPQEVQMFLKQIAVDIPFLVHDFQPSRKRSFYQTFDPADYASELAERSSLFVKLLKSVERLGFLQTIFAIEAIFDFLSYGKSKRFFDSFRHLKKQAAYSFEKSKYKYRHLAHFLRMCFWHLRHRTLILLKRLQDDIVPNSKWLFIRLKDKNPLFYPFRKIYWFLTYQYRKRVQKNYEA